jgi:GT2 family glycosyltransferase
VPTTSVSVIVVTLGREQVLVDTLTSILEQLPAGAELVVVDQTERHGPEVQAQLDGLAAGDQRVRLHRVAPPSTTAARNFGLARTSGDLVVFFDDDVLLKPGCLQAHIDAHLADAAVGGVVGRVEQPGQDVAHELYSMDSYGRERGSFDWPTAQPVGTLNGANMSYKRAAIVGAGGFDTSYTGNGWREESDAALRVQRSGWGLQFEPRAHLLHLANATGGARAYGSNYYATHHIYQNETLFFLHRFGFAKLPVLATRLARRGVIRKSALRDRSIVPRAAALVRGMVMGIWLYRHPRMIVSRER